MQQHDSPFRFVQPIPGVCAADGYGLRILVQRRHLIVSDGIGRKRRERRYAKATTKIKRLVVLGHEGFITLEALRWLADLGIGFTQIDRDGKVLFASAPSGNDDARLRRAQAMADSSTSLEVARYLMGLKLQGQEAVLARLGDETLRTRVANARARLLKVRNLAALRAREAESAIAYWGSWARVPVLFSSKDRREVPDHWLTFGGRHSPITQSPRLAANPANAMLNYLYAILEAETRIACLTVGLDPGMGVVHSDIRGRDSLVLDVVEAVRPKVDLYLLRLLAEREFRASDFHETRKGVCRVLSPLTHRLAETALMWTREIAPVVEDVAKRFGKPTRARKERSPTPITQSNRKEARRKRTAARSRRGFCVGCGVPVSDGRLRRYCEACLDSRMEDPDPIRMRSASMVRQRKAIDAWERTGQLSSGDPEVFRREILTGLRAVPRSKMAEVTGLSLGYASMIRRGLRVPHLRHWEKLRALVG